MKYEDPTQINKIHPSTELTRRPVLSPQMDFLDAQAGKGLAGQGRGRCFTCRGRQQPPAVSWTRSKDNKNGLVIVGGFRAGLWMSAETLNPSCGSQEIFPLQISSITSEGHRVLLWERPHPSLRPRTDIALMFRRWCSHSP